MILIWAIFFQVNVNDIQAQVSALPWVYSVAVRKQWPNEVKIYVVDQTPIAFWNGDFILNQFGKAFQAQRTALKQGLPEFFLALKEVSYWHWKTLII